MKWKCSREQVECLRAALDALQGMLQDVEDKKETSSPDAMARFVSDLTIYVAGIRSGADIMLRES
jgi:hypothetical protein